MKADERRPAVAGKAQETGRRFGGYKETLTDEELYALIAEVESSGMLRPPVDFKRNVMEKTKRADVRLVMGTQKMSKGIQLFCYSMKIGVAAAMALCFLFWVPQDLSMPELSFSQEENWELRQEETLAQKWDRGRDEVAERISQMAKQLLNQW